MTYKVKKGDTPEAIAARHGISKQALLKANPGVKETRLQIGQKLAIPSSGTKVAPGKNSTSSPRAGGGSYAVRNGENEWTIARKFGLTVRELHSMNPGVDFSPLQIGVKLRVPGSSKAETPKAVAVSKTVPARGSYKIAQGDNDWIIARKLGVTVANLHKLNPSVRWDRLQIGQAIVAPGAPKEAVVTTAAISTKRVSILKDDVNVRSKATTNSRLVGQVDRGQVASVVDRESGWYKLRFSGGTVGWVRGDMLQPVKASQVAAKSNPNSSGRVARNTRSKSSNGIVVGGPVATTALLRTAYSYQGVRYRWGGTSSRGGFDCSGFVGFVYRQHGVSLPRTSIQMSQVGTPVSQSELREGDLLFFKTQRGTRINHVGLYIGGGKFIHASSSGGKVQTDSLTGYYSRRLAGARRVTGKLTAAKVTPKAVPHGDPEPDTAEDPASAAPRTVAEPTKITIGTDEITR
ncbi:MAG TPA: NlpC/P60 family protein [Fimbriimonadaceae bacterium]|nr:NlpC/P60 family protein [Fimbriimonadaceae bacterium]HRJ97876.1 NlpC/P60 family protein [Fimbriimonadaceae bacterium]